MANKRKQPAAITLDPVAIGRRLRVTRCKRGWRQVDLANASGVNAGVIGAIEVGLRVPSRDAAIGLAVALRRSIEWILFGLKNRGQLHRLANGQCRAGGACETTRLGRHSPGSERSPAVFWSPFSQGPAAGMKLPRRRHAAANKGVSNEQ